MLNGGKYYNVDSQMSTITLLPVLNYNFKVSLYLTSLRYYGAIYIDDTKLNVNTICANCNRTPRLELIPIYFQLQLVQLHLNRGSYESMVTF